MLVICSMESNVCCLDSIKSKKDIEIFIEKFRVFASNHKNDRTVLDTIDETVKKCEMLGDQKSLVKLYEIKISQIEHLNTNIVVVLDLLAKMKKISKDINYTSGLALAFNIEWYVEKYRGNKERSKKALENSMKYISQEANIEEYSYYICNYSFAVEKWLIENDAVGSTILEKCADYFFKNGFYRSFAQTIAILAIIFTRMQNGNKILEKCRKIFENKNLFEELPLDVKGFSYYLTGLGYMMKMNLDFAESIFQKAYDILKPIHRESIYFSNFIILQSHMITVKALQGKTEPTWRMVKEVENLLEQEFFDKNLDLNTKKQIRHTLNLNKFYVYTRMKDFDSEEMQDLIEDLFKASKTLYSNFLLLSEYILNSNLEPDKLKELLAIDNFSINRVKHIIFYVLLSRTEQNATNKMFLEGIEILVKREKTEITTFIENVLADLLIAQQLFSLTRYGDIYSLLVKYKKQLNRIEVLEMRVFVEAFIQVGAYKNGDPLGPALQYMAIKKCRQYGFRRLESKLLDYLSIQGNDTLRMIV